MVTKLKGFIEEYAAEFATEFTGKSRTYVLATNLLIGDSFDIQDIEDLLGQDIDLAVYEDSGTVLLGGRFDQMERTIRFVVKDGNRQEAVNHAWEIAEWLVAREQRRMATTTFTALLLELPVSPHLILALNSGTCFAEVIATYNVTSKG